MMIHKCHDKAGKERQQCIIQNDVFVVLVVERFPHLKSGIFFLSLFGKISLFIPDIPDAIAIEHAQKKMSQIEKETV